MNRIVYLLLAISLLIPMLYVIFFTPFISLLLRQMKIGRSTGDVKNLVDDTEQAIANRVRDLEAQKAAADQELSDVVPIKIVRQNNKPASSSEAEEISVTILPSEQISRTPRTKKRTPTTPPTE